MLIENDYFNLLVQKEKVILCPKKNGFPLKSFDAITRQYPRLKISSFPILRKALMEVDGEHMIGSWLPDIEVFVEADKMAASLMINLSIEELNQKKQAILEQVEETLEKMGIVYGRKSLQDVLFKPGELIAVAVGTRPERGANAVITYLEIPERKPVIREDGSADYYEMNFVTPIEQGDWLGEKLPAQNGVDGSDIYGNVLPALKGDDEKLYYDRKSISEEADEESGKVVLRAIHGGALEYTNGVIGIGQQLIVSGDVGPETGSITFDGAVTVYGTVLAGYSVRATGDISIEGRDGVTNAKEIQSAEGSIYIKGGVFGGDMTIVEAQGDIFIKHANNCKLYGKVIHVGLYLLGAEIIAERVLVDRNRGKIIGGNIEAKFRIECAYAGNNHERTTILHAKGINKDALYNDIQEMAQDLKERQGILVKLEEHTTQFEKIVTDVTGPQAEAYSKTKETIESNRVAIQELDKEIQIGLQKIKQAVPAQIEVTREAYPGTVIQIESKNTTLRDSRKGIFELIDGVLNV